MADFSVLDRPEIRSVMFYPRRDRTPAPAGAIDLNVPVGDDVHVHVRIHAGLPSQPTILFFHGNGEVVSDYDDFAPIYARYGLNFAISDYRGYGASEGEPSYTTMMADAHGVKDAVLSTLDELGWNRGRYLMGRSLGGLSALELASSDSDGLRGLIMESSAANLRGWTRFSVIVDPSLLAALLEAQRDRLEAIRLPLLTIHGEDDDLIPVERAIEAHEAAGSEVKELLIVPRAGHNDLQFVGMQPYFETLQRFITSCESAYAMNPSA
jgi:uncharacterized protein